MEGQERIATAAVTVPLDGVAGEVAARYLAGAGVGSLRVRSAAAGAAARAIDARVRVEVVPGIEPAQGADLPLEDPAAGDVARGALFALRALREALGGRP
jgi:hypothetical protein